MPRKIKVIGVMLIMTFLVSALANQNNVIAEEEDYSFRTPKTFINKTDISDDKRHQLVNDKRKISNREKSNAKLNKYDDSNWDNMQLTHDKSLDLPYSQAGEAESGYTLGGVGWYRKSFTLDEVDEDKRVVAEFGGVYMNASVYINGHKLGDHPNGYTPFAYDLTDHLNYD